MKNSYKLIKKFVEYCPICDREHEIEERERISQLEIKGEIVQYKENYFVCTETEENENEFVNAKMMDMNLLKAKDEYRKKKGLLTSKQIKQIREKYQLTQAEFSFLLGLGEITITRYEKKLIQDETYDSLMRLVKENAFLALDYLRKNKSKFKDKARYAEIENNIKKVVLKDTLDFLNKEEIRAKYINFEEKSNFNGMKKIDIEKIEAILQYIAQEDEHLYKVKLMKLLWYIDIIYYKKYGTSLTGLVYMHQRLGALPIAYEELMKLESIDIIEEVNEYKNDVNISYKIKPNEKYIANKIKREEKEIIDSVIKKFKNYNTKQIVEYMHKESAYEFTKPNQIISYDYAKDISL